MNLTRPRYLPDHKIASLRGPVNAAGILVRSQLPKLHTQRDPKALAGHAKFNATYGAMVKMLDNAGIVGLAGQRGTGKTQMASMYTVRLADLLSGRVIDDTPIVYRRAIELCADIRNNQEGFLAAIKPYARAMFLVVDECHVRSDTAFELNVLTTIVDRRYCDRLPTLLISNELPDEFAKSLGESIVDRMQEGGGILPCDWESLRGAV